MTNCRWQTVPHSLGGLVDTSLKQKKKN